MFLGYASSKKGYRCLDIENKTSTVSRDVIFDEIRFPFLDIKSEKDKQTSKKKKAVTLFHYIPTIVDQSPE